MLRDIYRLNTEEMNSLLSEFYFEEEFKIRLGQPAVQKAIKNLAKELVTIMDVRKDGGIDVSNYKPVNESA